MFHHLCQVAVFLIQCTLTQSPFSKFRQPFKNICSFSLKYKLNILSLFFFFTISFYFFFFWGGGGVGDFRCTTANYPSFNETENSYFRSIVKSILEPIFSMKKFAFQKKTNDVITCLAWNIQLPFQISEFSIVFSRLGCFS